MMLPPMRMKQATRRTVLSFAASPSIGRGSTNGALAEPETAFGRSVDGAQLTAHRIAFEAKPRLKPE